MLVLNATLNYGSAAPGCGGVGGWGCVDLITLLYLLYVFGQIDMSKRCWSTLFATQQFYPHSQVVKWT